MSPKGENEACPKQEGTQTKPHEVERRSCICEWTHHPFREKLDNKNKPRLLSCETTGLELRWATARGFLSTGTVAGSVLRCVQS